MIDLHIHSVYSDGTMTPAEIVGLGERKGSIQAGKDADLICFDEDVQISGVMVEGKGLLGALA